MRAGNTFSYQAREDLIIEVSNAEIDNTLVGIDNSKTLGFDGFNACLFKQSWEVIKHDIYSGIKEFSSNYVMHKPRDCTAVTLITKIPNATKVKVM